MEGWCKSGCVLCAQNCGLEVFVEGGRMVRVRPDRENPRSEGYACRKGLNVIYHQYPEDRLTTPLKRVGGRFEPISWERALDEIAARMKRIVAAHGSRALAYMGGAAQGGQFEAAFGLRWLRGMGSQYYYSSAGQEFSGHWWVIGRLFGKQYDINVPDEHESEVLVAWGWNGMMSHQMPQARKVLKAFSKDPDRLLVSIDPRRSETAAIANFHLPVRPGTDALLMKAMIAIIVAEGWEKREYIEQHVADWERIRPWFEGFDARAAIEVCGLNHSQVHELCRILTTRRWSSHPDLGIYMGRRSTLNSYFFHILLAICGRLCVRGGNVIPGVMMPLGFHADERNPKTWRTVATHMPPAAAGSFPPNVMPEEILTDGPDRLRAVLISASNPLRAYADTAAYEEAFSKLELLVVNDIAMSETARLAHYVLPCRSFYESWDGSFFAWTYPGIFFQMRRPLVAPPRQCLEAAQIHTKLADRLGLLPQIPMELMEAAKGNRLAFGAKLMKWAATEPRALPNMPFILARTLGEAWDSAALAALWGMLMTAPEPLKEHMARAGFEPGPDQGDRVFQAILDNPQGLWVGRADDHDNFSHVHTRSGKLEIFIEDMEAEASRLDATVEAAELKMPAGYPLILSAGRHMDYNANSLMRNPEWNRGKRACTVALSPADAKAMGLEDGQQVKVTTEAASETGELQVTEQVRPGMVLIPHGFGLIYGNRASGINVNRLTRSTHRDPLGTPIHRFVPCRVEAAERNRRDL